MNVLFRKSSSPVGCKVYDFEYVTYARVRFVKACEVSIIFRKESFINAKKVLNFIQNLINEKKVIKSLTEFHKFETIYPQV